MQCDSIILKNMPRDTDYTHPNPPDDMPTGPFMLPWTRKPLGKPPKPGKGALRQQSGMGTKSKSGLHKLLTRPTHTDPYF